MLTSGLPSRVGRLVVAAGLLALLVSAAVPSLAAARAPTGAIEHVPGRLVPVFAGAAPATFRPSALPSRAWQSSTSSSLAQTSTIQVTYHNFSAKAQAAFQAAVDVWQSILVSDQVIHVDASWVDLGSASGILGQAGANNLYLDNDGFWYPGALEDARCPLQSRSGTGDHGGVQ